MKRRWIAMILALCLLTGLSTIAVSAASYDGSVDTERIIEGGKKMFSTFEGNYSSVVASDVGAVGMGIMGWRGPKALQLMKMICKAAPEYSLSVLGQSLYNEIVSASDTLVAWNNRTFDLDECGKATILISSEYGIAAQDELARMDILTYINYAWKAGIRSEAAILYYCSVENHYGHGGAQNFMKSIRATLGITENDTINSLDEFHNAVVQAAKTYSNVSSTLAYRTKVYNFIKNTLGWDISAHTNCPSAAFTDVSIGNWSHEGIDYALEHQLFNGTSATTFSPDAYMTRGMLVTVLYRMEGAPALSSRGSNSFGDVADNKYYSDAVQWAASLGIVTGISEDKFSPDSPITREQLAVILYRYSEYRGTRGEVDEYGMSIYGFSDFSSASSYATIALGWAIDRGLIQGSAKNGLTQLNPQGRATRAQVAVILMRYLEN